MRINKNNIFLRQVKIPVNKNIKIMYFKDTLKCFEIKIFGQKIQIHYFCILMCL